MSILCHELVFQELQEQRVLAKQQPTTRGFLDQSLGRYAFVSKYIRKGKILIAKKTDILKKFKKYSTSTAV